MVIPPFLTGMDSKVESMLLSVSALVSFLLYPCWAAHCCMSRANVLRDPEPPRCFQSDIGLAIRF